MREWAQRYLDIVSHDYQERSRNILVAVAQMDHEQRLVELREHSRQASIFAALNYWAADRGRAVQYSDEIDSSLIADGFDEQMRSKFRQRLENGYAREVYSPGSSAVFLPSGDFLKYLTVAAGREPIADLTEQLCRIFARYREKLETKAAETFEIASKDLPQALRNISAVAPVSRELYEERLGEAPFAIADAIRANDFRVEVGADGNFEILRGRIDPGAVPPFPPPVVETSSGIVEDEDYSISGWMDRWIALHDWKLEKHGEKSICRTANQYRDLAKRLIATVGVDDVRRLRGTQTIDELIALSQRLPKTIGKSSRNRNLTVDQSIAEAEAKAAPCGRAPKTLKRMKTQARAFLAFVESGLAAGG